MRIRFKKVVLHNFLSYGHSEIELVDKGYCMVSGVNNCALDRATSNGSGKSSWISAICYALTGETIQGVTKDIKNIYIDEDLCYVKLYFDIDKDSYEITRYNKPKSDLKIVINNEDKSGKGIRESELALARYIPDLTKDLISSVILLGQGLPNKLTSLSPANMKQRLEQLSKSDFMIEDIKTRITQRSTELSSELRSIEDSVLEHNTKLSVLNRQLENYKEELNKLMTVNYDDEISSLEVDIENNNNDINNLNDKIRTEDENYKSKLNDIDVLKNSRQQELDEANNEYCKATDDDNKLVYKLNAEIKSLNNEIINLKSIRDICPTCHQRIIGIVKPDTSAQEKELEDKKNELNECQARLKNNNDTFNRVMIDIKSSYDNKISMCQNEINTLNGLLTKDRSLLTELNSSNLQLNIKLASLKKDRDNLTESITRLNESISNTNKDIELINDNITKLNDKRDDTQRHIDVVKKMDTLVKRDFRGYLLSNVITYIDKKCKEYSSDIFGTDKLDFVLDGNNIEIRYCEKQYESLSGGEKQKVDLIIQFAIRDMLSQYLEFSSNILVLDEIFDNLDATGVTNVVNLVTNRFKDIESTFIISHHCDELCLSYDTEMKVVKNEKGVSEII